MSYCRFSDDLFRSDVYVYKRENGWYQIQVAGYRLTFDRSDLPERPEENDDNFETKFKKHYAALNKKLEQENLRKPIGGPHDGELFAEPTASKCADRLEQIEKVGYSVPDGVISKLRND